MYRWDIFFFHLVAQLRVSLLLLSYPCPSTPWFSYFSFVRRIWDDLTHLGHFDCASHYSLYFICLISPSFNRITSSFLFIAHSNRLRLFAIIHSNLIPLVFSLNDSSSDVVVQFIDKECLSKGYQIRPWCLIYVLKIVWNCFCFSLLVILGTHYI